MTKAIDYWFITLVVSLIFCTIPKSITLEFIGNTMGDKLSLYLIIIGTLYLGIKLITKYKEIAFQGIKEEFDLRVLGYYFVALIVIQIISISLGIINFPYYDQFTSNTDILPARFIAIFTSLANNYFGSTFALQLYLLFKGIKNIFLNSLWLFGGGVLIYASYIHLKKINITDEYLSKRYIKNLLTGIYISFGIIFIYSLFELPFLLGEQWAEKVLTIINPYIHQIGNLNNSYMGSNKVGELAYSWWPPLLWKHQVRSVFAEPSFFGVYCAFVIPWIWYVFINNKTKKNIIIGIFFFLTSTLVFLTQARTAIFLLLGEGVLLLGYLLYSFNTNTIKKILSILVITAIAWGCSLWFISLESNPKESNKPQTKVTTEYKANAEQYIKKNIKSVSSTTERSNKARYSLMMAELSVWKDHPLFGVGPGMKAAYLTEQFDESALKDKEVRMWVRRINDNGPFKSGYPNVSAYTVLLVETGIIGTILYLLPFLYLIIFFVKYLYRNRTNTSQFKTIIFFYLISLIGVLASGLTTSLSATYCLWVLLGVGLILREDSLRKVNS